MKPLRIKFQYRNHRQEINERDVTLDSIEFLEKPGYGYEPGWFIQGYDHDRSARRSFKFENIIPDPASPRLLSFNNAEE